jgi:hypothetical protein
VRRGLLGSCLVLLLVGVLAAPAEANAKKRIYHLDGPIGGSGRLHFDVKVKKEGGEWVSKRVANWRFAKLPLTCDSDSGTLATSKNPTRFPVRDGLFSIQLDPDTRMRIEGELTRNGKRATGQFEFGPTDFGLDGDTCATGELSWSAHKTRNRPSLRR